MSRRREILRLTSGAFIDSIKAGKGRLLVRWQEANRKGAIIWVPVLFVTSDGKQHELRLMAEFRQGARIKPNSDEEVARISAELAARGLPPTQKRKGPAFFTTRMNPEYKDGEAEPTEGTPLYEAIRYYNDFLNAEVDSAIAAGIITDRRGAVDATGVPAIYHVNRERAEPVQTHVSLKAAVDPGKRIPNPLARFKILETKTGALRTFILDGRRPIVPGQRPTPLTVVDEDGNEFPVTPENIHRAIPAGSEIRADLDLSSFNLSNMGISFHIPVASCTVVPREYGTDDYAAIYGAAEGGAAEGGAAEGGAAGAAAAGAAAAGAPSAYDSPPDSPDVTAIRPVSLTAGVDPDDLSAAIGSLE